MFDNVNFSTSRIQKLNSLYPLLQKSIFLAIFLSFVQHLFFLLNNLMFWFFLFKIQFLWRPRPPSFLTPEKEEVIAKNLKKYSKKYEAEDQDVSLLLSEQECEKHRILKEDWDKRVNEWKLMHEEKLEWQNMMDREASDKEEEYEGRDVEVEEVVEVNKEILH